MPCTTYRLVASDEQTGDILAVMNYVHGYRLAQAAESLRALGTQERTVLLTQVMQVWSGDSDEPEEVEA